MSTELEQLGLSWESEAALRQKVAVSMDTSFVQKAFDELMAAESQLAAFDERSTDGTSHDEDTRTRMKLQAVVAHCRKEYNAAKQKSKQMQARGLIFDGSRPGTGQPSVATAAPRGVSSIPVVSRSHSLLLSTPSDLKHEDDFKVEDGDAVFISHSALRQRRAAKTDTRYHSVSNYRGGEDVLPSASRVVLDARSRRDLVTQHDQTREQYEARLRRGQKRERSPATTKREGEDSSDVSDDDEASLQVVERHISVRRRVWNNLLDYQRVGVRWLCALHIMGRGGILGDEMGLGKTVQVAAYLCALADSHEWRGHALIVAPLTVLGQWIGELMKWAPSLRHVILHTSATGGTAAAEYASVLSSVSAVDSPPTVVVTTYGTLVAHHSAICRVPWKVVALDEGHKICNPDTNVAQCASAIETPHRFILSGSPIQNSLSELWALVNFTTPGLLGSKETFVAELEAPIRQSRDPRANAMQLALAVECAKALRARIAPFLLRRLKSEVNLHFLPPKHERVIRCELTDSQLECYLNVLASAQLSSVEDKRVQLQLDFGSIDKNHRAEKGGGLISGMHTRERTHDMSRHLYRSLSDLRMVCNHSDIYRLKKEASGNEDEDVTSFRSNHPVNLEGSGKLIALDKLLHAWHRDGHKAVVFTQSRMMLDIIENLVEQRHYRYIRMDGGTAAASRQPLIKNFNEDASVFVAIMTTKVGGLGVNLTGADRVIIVDPDWNPVNDEQARERCWRIGQTREVCIYRLITAGTVEAHILHRQLSKNYVTDKVLKDPTVQRFFAVHSLRSAFFLGPEYSNRVAPGQRQFVAMTISNDVSSEVDNELMRSDIEAAIRSHEEPTEFPKEEKEAAAEAATATTAPPPAARRRETLTLHRVGSTSGSQVKVEPVSPANAARRVPSTNDGVLTDLLGGRDVSHSSLPQDGSFAQRLAAASAQRTLQRAVSSSQGPR